MKYIVILGDGMADEPIAELGGKTPLQAANTPAMDYLALNGKCGTFVTVPQGFHPGSEIANLTVLGYDVAEVFEGRGSLEAASMGIPIEENLSSYSVVTLGISVVCRSRLWPMS